MFTRTGSREPSGRSMMTSLIVNAAAAQRLRHRARLGVRQGTAIWTKEPKGRHRIAHLCRPASALGPRTQRHAGYTD